MPRKKSHKRVQMHYDQLFTNIPGHLIWSLIIQPYLSIYDLAVLEVAVANKNLRALFYSTLDFHPNKSRVRLRSRKSITMKYPMFDGMYWQRDGLNYTIWTKKFALWLNLRNIHLQEIILDLVKPEDYHLLSYCGGLQDLSINVDIDSFMNYKIVKDLIPYYSSLQRLKSYDIDMKMVQLLSKYCSSLTSIHGRGVLGTYMCLSETIRLLPNIQHLQVNSPYGDISSVEEIFPNILSFSYCNEDKVLSMENITVLSRLFPNLTCLEISEATISSDTIAEYFRMNEKLPFQKITKLVLISALVGDGISDFIKLFPNLQTIVSTYNSIATDITVSLLKNCPNLTAFGFHGPGTLSSDILVTLVTSCPNLATLELYTLAIQNPIFEEKPKIHSLKSLIFNKCFLSDEGLENWGQILDKVKSLTFVSCAVEDDDAETLVSYMSPKSCVVFDDNKRISKKQVMRLKRKHKNIRFIVAML